MKKLKLLIMGMVCALTSYAQTSRSTIQLIDIHTKAPVAGSTVRINGELISTNEKGELEYTCKDSVQISVRHIGYIPVEKKVSCGNHTIYLEPHIGDLLEVQITGHPVGRKSLLEVPGSLYKMDTLELKRGSGLYLDEAINTNVPGVFMQRRTQSAGQQLNIRGYGNGIGVRGINSNFDGQGLKLYLNGIPVTDAEGITMMDDIDFGSLGSAEILKGPSGTMYGFAIAGVLNLKTQQADRTSISQELTRGSYGLIRTTTRLSIAGKNSSFMVNYGHQKFDGFMVHTATIKDFVNMIGEFRLNQKQSLTSYFGYADSYNQRNGELEADQYATFDYSGNPKYIKNDAHSAVRSFRAGTGHTYKFSDHVSNTTTLFGSGQSIDQSSAGGWTDKYPMNFGFRSTFNNWFKLSDLVSLNGVTGIEMQKMHAVTLGYQMVADSTNLDGYNVIANTKSNQAATNSTASYFTQWTLGLPGDISVTAGVGVSSMKLKLEDRLWAISNNHPVNEHLQIYKARYKNLVSPSAAINKKIGEKASVYASYSVGYKAPVSSNILISATGELNTDLKPEKGTQIEIGTKGIMMNDRLNYAVALFSAIFEDKFTVVTVQDPEKTATLYSYIVNGGSMKNNGLELTAKYDLVKSKTGIISMLRPFFNLTLSDFKYGDFAYEKIGKAENGDDSTLVEDYTGKQVAGVAPVVYNFGIDMQTRKGFYANLTYNFRSSMIYTSDGLNKADPFYLLNAKVGYQRTVKQFDLNAYIGANNITEKQTYYMVFVNQLPDAYIPAPKEINFFGGLNLRYNF